jgi:hypothetical protein
MAIDARLREGLQRSMSAVDADAGRLLGDARRRGHRRLVIGRAVVAVAVATVIAIVVVAAPIVLDIVRDQRLRPATIPSSSQIAGTYTSTITATVGVEPGSVGTWLLTIEADGTLDLASLSNGDFGRSVTQYQATKDGFLTTALTGGACSGVGRYTWSRSGSALTFTVLSDPCPLRAAIFSSHPWTAE